MEPFELLAPTSVLPCSRDRVRQGQLLLSFASMPRLCLLPSLRANFLNFPVPWNQSTQVGLPTPPSKCPGKSISSRQPALCRRELRGLPVLDRNAAHTR